MPERAAQQQRRNVVDLHCHTSASRTGIGLPPSVISFFRRNHYRACSLTEHDNTDSLVAARDAAREVGIEFIPGIEMSVAGLPEEGLGESLHLLGYFVDPSESLAKLCREISEFYEGALEELLARLFAREMADVGEEDLRQEMIARCGEYDVWKKPSSTDILSRVLVKQGVLPQDGSRTLRELFFEICPDISRDLLPSRDAVIKALRDSGATIMLAHPLGTAGADLAPRRELLCALLDTCIDGLEVFYPNYDEVQRSGLLEIVRGRGRPYTGGSDTHVFDRPAAIVHSNAPYHCVESIREFRATGVARTYPDEEVPATEVGARKERTA